MNPNMHISRGSGISPPSSPSYHHPPISSSSTQACAACKYQRRKCQPNCTLAPYFPADQQRSFLNAHRLFGVSNILKTLRGLDPVHHHDAMASIVFHSNCRAQDPILGCYRVVMELHRDIAIAKAHLDATLRQLALYRAAENGGDVVGSADAATIDYGMVLPQLPFLNVHNENAIVEHDHKFEYFHPSEENNGNGSVGVGVVVGNGNRIGNGNENVSSSSSVDVLGTGGDLPAYLSGIGSDMLYNGGSQALFGEANKIVQNGFHTENNFDINNNIDINSASHVNLEDEPPQSGTSSRVQLLDLFTLRQLDSSS